MLAPEVYLPLRLVGMQFHASVDGLAAADQAFAVLHLPLPPAGTVTAPDLRTSTLELRDVVVQHDGRRLSAPDGASLTLRPGTVTVLSGPSGSGKSTLAEVVLRLRAVQAGRAEVVDASGRRTPLAAIEQRSWLDQAAWLGQQAVVVPGTVRANVLLLGGGDGSQEALTRAASAAGLADVVAGLPRGWDTPVGDGGYGLSAGQRQRLALTRVLLADAPLVVLDEPSAHLDHATEAAVRTAVAALRADGRTVLVIAHRAALAAGADQVVTLAPPARATHRSTEPDAAAPAGWTTRLVGAP